MESPATTAESPATSEEGEQLITSDTGSLRGGTLDADEEGEISLDTVETKADADDSLVVVLEGEDDVAPHVDGVGRPGSKKTSGHRRGGSGGSLGSSGSGRAAATVAAVKALGFPSERSGKGGLRHTHPSPARSYPQPLHARTRSNSSPTWTSHVRSSSPDEGERSDDEFTLGTTKAPNAATRRHNSTGRMLQGLMSNLVTEVEGYIDKGGESQNHMNDDCESDVFMTSSDEEDNTRQLGLARPLLSEVSLSSQEDVVEEGDTLVVGGVPLANTPHSTIYDRYRNSPTLMKGRRHHSGDPGYGPLRTSLHCIKGMVGVYVLYLPHLFAEGGLLFSLVALTCTGAIATFNLMLLHKCRSRLSNTSVSYSDIGLGAFGPKCRMLVEASLVCSQLGYCVTYLIYVANNISETAHKLWPSYPFGNAELLIAMQIAICIPLAWIRKLRVLGILMFVANACFAVGLLFTTEHVVSDWVEEGIVDEVDLINTSKLRFLLFLGGIVLCFEGIGLIIPIQDAMQDRHKHTFPSILYGCGVVVGLIFAAFGCGGYLVYGADVKTFLTQELPPDKPAGITARVAVSVAMLATYPLQLLPAVKVLDRAIWPPPARRSSHSHPLKSDSTWQKTWLKNLLRAFVVALTAAVAVGANTNFDSFIGVVGGLSAVPLVLVYPLLFHLKLSWGTLSWKRKFFEGALLSIGCAAGAACAAAAAATW